MDQSNLTYGGTALETVESLPNSMFLFARWQHYLQYFACFDWRFDAPKSSLILGGQEQEPPE